MQTFNIHEAKTHLSRLVEAAAKGESFIIAKAGKPMVKVLPLDAPVQTAPYPRKMQRLGFMKGQIKVPDEFDTMFQQEIIKMFEAEED